METVTSEPVHTGELDINTLLDPEKCAQKILGLESVQANSDGNTTGE